MIPLSIALVLGIAGSAMSRTESRRAFLLASLLRVGALCAVSWWLLIGPQGAPVMWPIVVFGFVSLTWTTIIGAAWPDYVVGYRSTVESDGKPDRRVTPLVVTLGIGWPLLAVAFALTSWLFLTDFQRSIDASGVGFGYSTRPTLYAALGISAFIAVCGVLALIIGRRRNPWYPAQSAYLKAAIRRGDERRALMQQAVALAPRNEALECGRPRA